MQFKESFPGGDHPVILTQVQSYYGSNFVTTRQQQVDTATFLVALEEEGSFDQYGTQTHTNVEEVGWVAFEPAAGNFGTINFEAGHTPQAVTNADYTITFTQTFDFAPRFFARMATYQVRFRRLLRSDSLLFPYCLGVLAHFRWNLAQGTDSSQVRTSVAAGTSTVDVHVEEEACSDFEQTHAPEVVDYVAFDSRGYDGIQTQGLGGILYGKSNLNRGCENIYGAAQADLSGGAILESDQMNANSDLAGSVSTDQFGQESINFGSGTQAATWNLGRCLSGHYTIVFSYALTSGDRPMSVTVNGVVVDGFLAMPATNSWSTYREVRVAARLSQGNNVIALSTIGFSGPNVDVCPHATSTTT